MGALPSLLSWTEGISFDFFGQDFTEAWKTFTVRVKASDPTVMLENSDYFFDIVTTVDCLTGLSFNLQGVFYSEIAYTVGSATKRVVYEPPTDSISEATLINQVCGPVAFSLYGTDALGSTLGQLPSFV